MGPTKKVNITSPGHKNWLVINLKSEHRFVFIWQNNRKKIWHNKLRARLKQEVNGLTEKTYRKKINSSRVKTWDHSCQILHEKYQLKTFPVALRDFGIFFFFYGLWRKLDGLEKDKKWIVKDKGRGSSEFCM